MELFVNGVRFDYKTGHVKFYMNKPKVITESLKGKMLKINHTTLCVDEFDNKRGIRMLSFRGVVYTTHSDFRTEIINIRSKITNEVHSLSSRYSTKH